MLHSSGCQELSVMCDLVASSDTSIIDNVPMKVQKIVGCLVRQWWKNHDLPKALLLLKGGNMEMVSHANT
jgi:hypothetical protein